MFKTIIGLLNNASASLDKFNSATELRIKEIQAEHAFMLTKAGHELRHSQSARDSVNEMRARHHQLNLSYDEDFYTAEYNRRFNSLMAATAHLVEE